MSEVLDKYKKQQFEWQLQLTTALPLHYALKESASLHEFLFCLEIPFPLLNYWRSLLQGKPTQVSYIDLLNATIVDGFFMIKRECCRIEELLRKKASSVKNAYNKAQGRKKKNMDNEVYKISIRRGEVESVSKLKAEINECNIELEEWEKKYENLSEAKEKLYNDMIEEIDCLEREIEDLESVNKELSQYIQTLTENKTPIGKKIHEVQKQQKGRKLCQLKNRAQCALWFCESYGLELKEIKLKSMDGSNHTLNYGTPTSGGYAKLSEDEKNKVEQLLFLLDKFCIGDEIYHELSMITDGLPRSYLIKQARTDLNKTYHIERTPGHCPGSMLNFNSTLRTHISELLKEKPELKKETIQVKLSGDGAKMSRTTNFMMFSFTLLQLEERVMSSKSNRTIAIVNGHEEYKTLQISFLPIFNEINHLIEKGTLTVDDNEIKLDFFLGGDLKFLLMIMGLSNATANYACLWCKIHKDQRWDTTKTLNFYNEDLNVVRTLDEIPKCCGQEKSYGCKHEPLININLTKVIPDELHLLLRITDRLLENIIDEVVHRDESQEFLNPRGPKQVFLTKFVNSVNSLGISFSVWNKKNADGSISNIKDCTSLLGTAKKILLKGLPSKFHEFLYADTCSTVKKIWEDFEILYKKISDFNLKKEDGNDLFLKAKAWIDLFCSLNGKRHGYDQARVTPYMHAMAYYIPYLVKMHGCMKKFTGQGVEKNNDDAKRVMFSKSNKWDAATDILLLESRQWDLKEHERSHNKYTKRKLEWWGSGIS